MNVNKLLENMNKGSMPKWLPDSIQYLGYTGSHAYGTNHKQSDYDIVGFCIPPKEIVFPHLRGEIEGFGRKKKRFRQWEVQHSEYDITIYSLPVYFSLVMENNPNMIDSLFLPENCIIYMSHIGKKVVDKRHMFLHKGAFHRFKGYAYSQLHKIETKTPKGKRKELIEKHGYDVKYAMHLVRLLNECEQILLNGDLDLLLNREQLKSILRGEWTIENIKEYFRNKEMLLEKLYVESSLPYQPDEEKIRMFLADLLNEFYGEKII